MQPTPRVTVAALIVAVSSLTTAGCQRDDGKALDEIKDQHRQILSRLADLEQKIDRIAARPAAPQRAQLGPDPARTYQLPVESSPVKGPADAPITIVEFSDYQCPFCARSESLIAETMQAYPTQVRVVFKHFPLSSKHPAALPAALAATAAQKQGKFWEMHAILFANQRTLSPEQIEGYARQIGLDMKRFKSDMESEAVKQQVEADRRLARRAGVQGTPTVFVNGRLLQDRTLNGVKALVDPLLQQATKVTPKAGG